MSAIPRAVTAEERWICNNRVAAIRVEFRQTGTDTAETYIHLTSSCGKTTCWLDRTFAKVAVLRILTDACVEPAYGVREAVKSREKWEKENERELLEYKRLKDKFEGAAARGDSHG